MTGAVVAAITKGASIAPVICTPESVQRITSAATPVTPPTTVTPSAASYAWTIVSGDTVTIDSPTAQTTTFSAMLANGETRQCVCQCTTPAGSATVNVYIERI